MNLKVLFAALGIIFFLINPALAYRMNNDEKVAGSLYVDFGLKYEMLGNITSKGKGFGIDFGFNLGKIFKKDLVVAPYCGLSTLWGNEYASSFLSDLNNKYEEPVIGGTANTNNNSLDIARDRIYSIREGAIKGCIQYYYGVLLKYPHKYCPPIKLYMLADSVGIRSTSTGPGLRVVTPTSSANRLLSVSSFGWGMEVFVYSFLKHTENTWAGTLRLGYISVYLDQLKYKDAVVLNGEDSTLDPSLSTRDVRITEFTNDSFDEQYKTMWRIGLKIGLCMF